MSEKNTNESRRPTRKPSDRELDLVSSGAVPHLDISSRRKLSDRELDLISAGGWRVGFRRWGRWTFGRW
jgi:hypothetical protein